MTARVGRFAFLGILVFIVAALLTAGKAAPTRFEYPEDRVGDIAEAYITAFSSGQDSLMVVFQDTFFSRLARERYPVDEQLWRYRRLYAMLGALSPERVVASEETTLVLLAKSEALGTWFHVNIELDDGTPRMVRRLLVEPAARPE